MSELAAGSLLVAAPVLVDPHFVDSVVLLLDVDDDGALGVVLNRPSPVPVGEVLGDWSGVVTGSDVLYRGGPVGTDGALALGRLGRGREAPVGFRTVFGTFGMVDLDTPVELVEGTLDGLRIFAGYSGWGAGQLDGEVEAGAWYVVPSVPADVFTSHPEALWRGVLARQPGELAWASTRPVDADLN